MSEGRYPPGLTWTLTAEAKPEAERLLLCCWDDEAWEEKVRSCWYDPRLDHWEGHGTNRSFGAPDWWMYDPMHPGLSPGAKARQRQEAEAKEWAEYERLRAKYGDKA